VFLEIGRLEKRLIFLCGDGLYSWRFEDWRKDESSYVKMDYIPGDWKIGEGMDPPTGRTEDDSWRLGDWSKVRHVYALDDSWRLGDWSKVNS